MKKFLKLENFIYLTIVSLPLYLIRFSIFGLPTNVFEIMALASIIMFFISARSLKNELRAYSKYFIPIGLIIGGLVLSMLFNGSYRTGLGVIKSWFIIPLIFAFIATVSLQEEKKKTIFSAIYISAFLVACVALGYFLLGKITFDGRLQAIFNSPNYLAMYLSPAIIIGLVNFKKNKKSYTFSLLIIASVLYLTFSYAAWLAALISLGLIWFLQKRIGKKSKNISWIIIGMIIVIFWQLGTVKMTNLIHLTERSSLASRMMIWRSAGKMIIDNPIIGIGPGNFQTKYLAYQKYFPPYLEWAVPEPHNLLLAFWLQTGIIGLVGFITLMFMWFKALAKEINNLSENTLIALAIVAMVLVHGFLDTTYFKNDLAVLFWLTFLALKKNRSRSEY
jgi:O-antigen ligase